MTIFIKTEIKEIKIHHETNKLLNYAIYLANENGDELVAEDYLLLAVISEKNNLSNIFKSQKINEEKLDDNKILIKTIDLLGRASLNTKFYIEIYNDGSVKKHYKL